MLVMEIFDGSDIGGPLKYGTNLLALSSTLLILLRNKVLVPFMIMPSIFYSNHLIVSNHELMISRYFHVKVS